MYGFAKRQRTPDWRFVALKTKRGLSGRSCSVALVEEVLPVGGGDPLPDRHAGRDQAERDRRKVDRLPRQLPQRLDHLGLEALGDAALRRSRASATRAPSTPAVIEPPETLDTRSSFGR